MFLYFKVVIKSKLLAIQSKNEEIGWGWMGKYVIYSYLNLEQNTEFILLRALFCSDGNTRTAISLRA